MDVLKRTLVEKAGHDSGFEYTVSETPESLTLGSARHPLQVEIALANGNYLLLFSNAKQQLLNELKRDFLVQNREILTESLQGMAVVFKRAAALAHSLPNQAENDFASVLKTELNKFPDNIKNTEVERIIRQRVGQDVYRKAMLEYWGGACAVTGVTLSEVLRASHALPWSKCESDSQRLDIYNGLLLNANLDALFDRYLISFDKNGHLLISDKISNKNFELLGLNENMKLRWITVEHEIYLSEHRKLMHLKSSV
ncbi:HNH endonuclease [Acinetobacter seifertii]|uniref:HNH endonuclease n=1 Tax=Acinetobacter seifertii TaxID=1530123 RepID=A0ABX8LBN6_9GAMM|nr:HNH endonuclease signature motif containing protein [Acinetobacter seifertii]QXB47578.1 HNH endonuclease [Acinetobacter seifertii]